MGFGHRELKPGENSLFDKLNICLLLIHKVPNLQVVLLYPIPHTQCAQHGCLLLIGSGNAVVFFGLCISRRARHSFVSSCHLTTKCIRLVWNRKV